jgi:hypothetical protein
MTDSQEFFLQLVEHALNDEHTKFEQLRYFDEYLGARSTYRATKKVIKVLAESADELFKKYCKAVHRQHADVNMLIAYKQLRQAITYYKEEQKIVRDTLEDYEYYLLDGNFVKAIFFGEMRDLWH